MYTATTAPNWIEACPSVDAGWAGIPAVIRPCDIGVGAETHRERLTVDEVNAAAVRVGRPVELTILLTAIVYVKR